MELKKNLFAVENGVATITMNFPKNLNALDLDMANELLYLLDECEKNSDVKAVVLRSGGKAFSAGGDIGYFYETIQAGGEIDMDELLEKAGRVSLAIKKMSKMVITSVAGAAAGAGANLALSGDIVVCAENAKFIEAFINLGLVPDTGGSYLLCRGMGAQKAMELCATGAPLSAADAKTFGLVNEVCPLEELDERTAAWAKRFAAGPLFAYKKLKEQFFAANYADYEKFLTETELPTQSACMKTEDFKEGVCAFIEKRKPAFSGK